VWAAGMLALVALVWGLSLAGIYRDVVPGELFQEWEMKDERIEVAREASGLLLIAAWMGIVICTAFAAPTSDTSLQARS
jgi:hypothetical protein